MIRLKEYAKELQIELTDEQIGMFKAYYEMLIETNKVMNLTAITELDEVITKHFIDSIALAKAYPDINANISGDYNGYNDNGYIDSSEALVFKDTDGRTRSSFSVLDLGTGAGFPGIPLKIAFPDLNIVLMDSLNKRVKFLKAVIDELGLQGITAIHGRAEEMARQKNYREQFDICVSRAVANLSTLSEYCLPFVKSDGCFISYKSADIEEELSDASNAINILGGKLTAVKKLTLPGSDIERAFVIIHKTKKTPKTYPRKAGTATKNPL
ncbi:MAG: 16S rRNA (guanine(527)-N(7))-methyltransferase RsmG [Lachnospiraceae bacterium]|nr:16S rRNA (guanine(527)-N(7))-methyltransferase RsmG [Lachnospiraceae bacterium]